MAFTASDSEPAGLPAGLSFLSPVDHECDRAITRMHDDDLISCDKETVLTKFRHPIKHDRSELMKRHVFGDFCPECQAQAHVHHGEIWRDAVAHQRYLSLTQTKPLRHLWPTLAPISRIDHVDDHVGSRIDDANVVVHHEVAVVAIIREEHKYSTRDAEQAHVPRDSLSNVVVEACPRHSRLLHVECAMQFLPLFRP